MQSCRCSSNCSLDASTPSARDDVSAAPPAYSDAVSQNNAPCPLGLGLDQSTLVSSPSYQMSHATRSGMDAALLRLADSEGELVLRTVLVRLPYANRVPQIPSRARRCQKSPICWVPSLPASICVPDP